MSEMTEEPIKHALSERTIRNLNLAFMVIYVVLICVTTLGDSNILRQKSDSIGTLSKIVSMGTIGLAALKLLLYADPTQTRRFVYYLLLMIAPLLFGLFWSFGIWIYNLEDISMMTKGLEKLLFQFINAFVALSAIILFREKAIDLTFDGIIMGNFFMLLLGVKEYGIGPSITSVIDGIFGGTSESYGFMNSMEINDVTFAIGIFLVYYLVWGRGRRGNLLRLAIGSFFFILGYKRIAIFGIILGCIVAKLFAFLADRKKGGFIALIGFLYLFISFGYVCIVRAGVFTMITRAYGIETMGRNNLFEIASQFYEISVIYIGYGLQVAGTLMSKASNGELTALHNDILVFYIELGFVGFFIWFGYYYIGYTHLIYKHCSTETVAVYMACLTYMMITYFTDNTFFYYWDSYCMRLIPLAFSMPVAHKMAKSWRRFLPKRAGGWKAYKRWARENAYLE